MPQFEIITFDCYGTLIDWENGITNAFQKEASKDGKDFTKEEIVRAHAEIEPVVQAEFYQLYSDILTEVAERMAIKLGWEISTERARFLATSLPSWQPFTDTNNALERLAKRYQLGLLSNIDDELLAETRKHFTVNFQLVVTAEQVHSYKPNLEHFFVARDRRGKKTGWLHAAQSYFHDIIPTNSLEIPSVWVNRKNEKANEGGPYPTYQVNNLVQLADLLEQVDA
ncbi:MAG: HAD hydrolase-like protein [Acidobacteria bacterium]|nr:HAD hydrolase-like protein [Acidobacteriota bacterium]